MNYNKKPYFIILQFCLLLFLCFKVTHAESHFDKTNQKYFRLLENLDDQISMIKTMEFHKTYIERFKKIQKLHTKAINLKRKNKPVEAVKLLNEALKIATFIYKHGINSMAFQLHHDAKMNLIRAKKLAKHNNLSNKYKKYFKSLHEQITAANKNLEKINNIDDLMPIINIKRLSEKIIGSIFENAIGSSGNDPPPDNDANNLKFAVDDVLHNMQYSSMAFNYPTKMAINETAHIKLIIDPQNTIKEIKKKLHLKGVKIAEKIRIHNKMKATITSPDLLIKTITEETQFISNNEETFWEWYITAKKEGINYLSITISAVFDIGYETTPKTLITFKKTVNVQVKKPEIKDCSIVFTYPEKMLVNETVRLKLIINPQTALEQTKHKLKPKWKVLANTAKIHDKIKATITSPDLLIKKITEETQFINNKEETFWEWYITAKKEGNNHLSLTVLNIKEKTKSENLINLSKTINVRANENIIIKFIRNYWQWIITVIIIPLISYIWKKYSKNK